KPSIDLRYAEQHIVAHTQQAIEAHVIEQPNDIFTHLTSQTNFVIIDEIQFFDRSIISTFKEIFKRNIGVIASGLFHDYKHEPFTIMPELKNLSEQQAELTGDCFVCGKTGTHTFRKSTNNKEIVLVGGAEFYECRCQQCHTIDTKTQLTDVF
ncbi:hypothetical protein OAH12_01900, partial [Cyclobacteriaceae bacterium]|nr:hypothetical protein [Cyclobacteriaceae bacterium]